MKPDRPDLDAAVDAVLEARRKRAEHLRSLDDLDIVEKLERIASLIDSSRSAWRHWNSDWADELLEKARCLALELLGIDARAPQKEEAECSRLAEVVWQFHGDVSDPNWTFLRDHANFSHREACEFILHIGDDRLHPSRLPEYARRTIQQMKDHGCSDAFIEAYTSAAKTGATRVLFCH